MGKVADISFARSLTAVLAVVLAALMIVPADGAMRSRKLGPKLCETTGGGRFVKIPGSPGERIDRRLLNDVRYLKRQFNIFITDGYSLDPVHSSNGEHPRGLALDIVPNASKGGRWRDITRLANWAEPQQNRPRSPFRWVGYNGDAGHGRGHHLHLSWSHTDTGYNKPARTVWTIKCPDPVKPAGDGGDGGGGSGPTGGTTTSGGKTGSGGTGGISARGGISVTSADIARVHRETGGVSAP